VVKMSLINQVLNDLEKRGATREATGGDTVRVVHVQSDIKWWPYVLAGLFALFIVTLIGLYVRKHSVLQQPIVQLSDASSSVPIVGVMSISHISAISQPQAASSVEQTSMNQPDHLKTKTLISATTSASSVEQTSKLPYRLPVNSQIRASIPTSEVAASSNITRQSVDTGRISITTKMGMPIKKVSPHQQAENEFRHAYLLAQQGKLNEAATGYKMALNLDPAHVLAREALVSVLLESKRYVEAEVVLQEALKLDEKQTHLAMLLARLQVERNAVELAIETLSRTLPYANRLAEYQAFMAALLQRQERHKDAVTYYQNALEITPTSGLWLMGLGISLQAELRKEEALDSYKHALDTHQLSPDLEAFVNQKIKEIKTK
jgi:MSHA biogenesis protein MshN